MGKFQISKRRLQYLTVHFLRQGFASYLLESGVELRYIHELLDPKKAGSIQIFAQVVLKDLARIRSPLDGIIKG